VLHRVAESFLQNPEQAYQHVLRNVKRKVVVRKVNLDFLLLGIFPAEAPYGKNDPEVFEFRGMEAVGYCVNITGDVLDLVGKARPSIPEIAGAIRLPDLIEPSRIANKARRWLMSSWRSLAIRVRSCSCASISLRLTLESTSSACLCSVTDEIQRLPTVIPN
jgi:hypothetical protein